MSIFSKRFIDISFVTNDAYNVNCYTGRELTIYDIFQFRILHKYQAKLLAKVIFFRICFDINITFLIEKCERSRGHPEIPVLPN